jgi:hypothetical protein
MTLNFQAIDFLSIILFSKEAAHALRALPSLSLSSLPLSLCLSLSMTHTFSFFSQSTKVYNSLSSLYCGPPTAHPPEHTHQRERERERDRWTKVLIFLERLNLSELMISQL